VADYSEKLGGKKVISRHLTIGRRTLPAQQAMAVRSGGYLHSSGSSPWFTRHIVCVNLPAILEGKALTMSGHSKWSTIKHKKAAKDAKKGKLFTKFIKEITVAARMGGGDLNSNPRLRTAVTTARAASMPGENIDRAIKKGTGELEGVTYEEIQYEGYGPGGAAIIAQVLTDNKNRTVSEVRRLFAKHGGNLGETGCVSWMFDKKGLITIEKSQVDEERLMGIVLDAGAEDVRDEDDLFEVVTPVEDFAAVKDRLDQEKIVVASAQVTLVPKNTVDVDAKHVEQILKLTEELEDHDDVQSVSANFNIPNELMDKAS
jgi:YebC/PmpR family DNA-binding regulatory protein